MRRRDFIKHGGTLALAAGIMPSFLQSCTAQDLELTILHTNDMHSRIEPFPENSGRNSGMGGMARRAAMVNKIRSEVPNVLLLDSGDVFQGTPYFNFFGGELEFKLMSEMGYDASTLGNHDFDNGLEGLDRMLPNAKFPFLNSNYDFSKTILKDRFKPYRIIQKGPIKVGVFGVGIELQNLVPEKLYQQTEYNDPIEISKEMVQELKGQGCDFIICLSHLGFKYESDKIDDHKLAEAVSGIDLILGGHTHSFLDEPERYTNSEGFETVINQVGWAGIYLGRIDVTFAAGGNKQMSSALMPVMPTIT